MSVVATILLFVIVLGILVCLHELGHFIVAKVFRVRVDEFGIGFPPRIASIQRGGTTYSLNILPLGGFVRIKGIAGERRELVNTESKPETDQHRFHDSDSFSYRPVWQRLSILLAGILANCIVAVALFALAYGIGVQSPVMNPSQTPVSDQHILITNVVQGLPASDAGLQAGDTILQFANTDVHSADQLQSIAKDHVNQTTSIVVERGGSEFTTSITPTPLQSTSSETPYIGIGVEFTVTHIIQYPIFQALWNGCVSTVTTIEAIFIGLWHLLQGALSGVSVADQFTGPVGIAQMSGQAYHIGFTTLLQFMALLSVNLAVFNFLPIPALDGGRLLFLIIEVVRRKPVNERTEAIVHTAGFLVLISLVALVTYKDILQAIAQ